MKNRKKKLIKLLKIFMFLLPWGDSGSYNKMMTS